MTENASYPLLVKRDLDGFFGLFIDNLVQLLLIVQLCGLCGIAGDSEILLSAILPGAAVSILFGNISYAWQARRLARKENRSDVTALPYGINTPSLLIYIFFVMKPVYDKTGDPQAAWAMGLIACLGSGVIELTGSLFAESIRRHTPRAALLSTLAGIAIGFISMTFALQIFNRPLVAMLPLAIILITYFSHVGFPLGLPGGFVAVVLGTACAWTLPFVLPESIAGPAMDAAAVRGSLESQGSYLPGFFGNEIWELLSQPGEWIKYLSVIIPMGLFNVMGSLQNIESAEAGGDRYNTGSSLAVNGIGTIAAALCGSCFPTTIYIGHPGWKGLGARAGYSTLNGLAVTAICLTGTVVFISRVVPMDAGIAIVLWIGVIMTAQAFQATPKEHAPAVAIGLFPAIAAWGATVTIGAIATVGFATPGAINLQQILEGNPATEVNGFLVHGMITMERGYIFTCMILAAVAAFLIDRKFFTAAIWSLVAAVFTAIGLMHTYQVLGNNVDFLFNFSALYGGAADSGTQANAPYLFRGFGIAIGYLLFAVTFAAFGWYQQKSDDESTAG